MKTLATLSCLLVCFLLIGCKGGGGSDVVGKWKGSADIPAGKENDPATKMAQEMMGSMVLELKSDKTFALTMFLNFEGTWTQAGSTVTLTMTKMGGKETTNSDKPLVLTLSSDGQTLTGEDKSGKGAMKFTRQK